MLRRRCLLITSLGSLALLAATARAAEPVALHVRPLPVTPAHTPMVYVLVENASDQPYQGTISVDLPGDWKTVPDSRPVELKPAERTEVSFASEGGVNRPDNRYPVTVTATTAEPSPPTPLPKGEGSTAGLSSSVSRQQVTVCASAPYFKPEIDGEVDDWEDAIPITWQTDGKRTTLRTYWNRRSFSVLVEVEEDELVDATAAETRGASSAAKSESDCVQLTLAPRDDDERFEFLLRPNEEKPADGAELVVRRENNVTRYECMIPMRPMRRELRPTEGREFRLGLTVHDAGQGATEPRDVGTMLGREPGSLVLWGMCSSKY
jgi:hypothetical protein